LRARLELGDLPSFFRQVLAQTTDKRDRDATHRATPEARRKISGQRKQYKRFIYASSQDKELGREHIGNDEDIINTERLSALDEKFNIFAFPISPRTVLIQNIPRDADPGKLREKIEKMTEIIWLQAEDALCRGRERLNIWIVTSSEMRANRIVANTLNHRFHKSIMESHRPGFMNMISERSVLMPLIPRFMTPSLLFLRLERAGTIYDFWMAK
jgi:hypothetical protein